MQEVFREHVRRTAQVPHGWMSSRYGAGIVDTVALLKSMPAASVRLGFGPPKHSSLLGCPLPVWLSRHFLMAASGRYSALLPVFENELNSIALLDGHPMLSKHADAKSTLGLSSMSQALKRWLRVH